MKPTTNAWHTVSIGIALLLSGCGWDRWEADREIERLCKIDGGVKVFEHDAPPKEFMRLDGKIDLQKLGRASNSQTYYLLRNETVVRRDPLVVRFESSLIRGSDKHVLGTKVSYIRPRDHSYVISLFPKHKVCPIDDENTSLAKQVFRWDVSFY